MQQNWNVYRAMIDCPHKAWKLTKSELPKKLELEPYMVGNEIIFPSITLSADDKMVLTALFYDHLISRKRIKIRYGAAGVSNKMATSAATNKALSLVDNTSKTFSKDEPPPFYKNKHCPHCTFWQTCYQKLKERDCLSLLGGISPKVVEKYHSRGIFTITQLSHLFRPRRRGRKVTAGKSLWELKALAIREKKTFVLQPPDLIQRKVSIYVDFEGLPDENFYYLLGVLIKEEGQPETAFSFWADNKDHEAENFRQLIALLDQYPEVPVYHYGSYEGTAFRQVANKLSGLPKEQLQNLEKRLVNVLSYLRTHVYPPTYGNGLKEIAGWLSFQWRDGEASGLHSISWRKNWESGKATVWKEKLIHYNQDDCRALATVHHWLKELAVNASSETVQQVAALKKHTPYKLQGNKEYGDDFQYISKAAYFDYQRSKVYWRGETKKLVTGLVQQDRLKRLGQGIMVWKPKKINKVITLPPLEICPHCGHSKLYRSKKITAVRQTDLKFTSSGVRQYVIEYRAGKVKCAKCEKKANDADLRIKHYGDNVFALATHLYINYNISNELVSRFFSEHYGIWISQMYLVQYKQKWWQQWQPEVDYIKRTVLNSPVIHIDETSVKLTREKGYVWVFTTSQTVFYHLTLTREVDFLHELLKDYHGIVVTDFFPGYEGLTVKRQMCLIHLIRDLNDDLFKNPFDEEYKGLVSGFSTLLRKIITTIDKYGLQERHLHKHVKDTERYYKQFIERAYKSVLAIKYAKRLKKHWKQLWTFLEHDDVPWNNNNAETALKAFALYRRGVNGQVSEKGLKEYLPMLSLAQTCRYRNLSFLDFLRHKKGIWQNIPPNALPGYLPFSQARLFVHKLKLDNQEEWNKWATKSNLPFLPNNPEEIYADKGWLNFNTWLGLNYSS